MLIHRVGMPGRGRHEVMVVGQLEGYAIVENNAVLAQHDAVTAHAGFQIGEAVGVKHFKQL